MGVQELLSSLSLHHKVNFHERYLRPGLKLGMIERTLPASPNSPTQKYRLTEKGRRFLATLRKTDN